MEYGGFVSETVTVAFAIIYLGIEERTVISGLYAAGTEYSRIMADLKNESDDVMECDLIIICEHIQ